MRDESLFEIKDLIATISLVLITPLKPIILCLLTALVYPCVLAQEKEIPSLTWTPRSDWINIISHGASGDGLADDTAAIQTVLDSVTDGSTVYFPPGHYRITQSLSLNGPLLGVLIVGHGRDTLLTWDGEDGGSLFIVNGAPYSRFVGLSFDGKNKAAYGLNHLSPNRFETEVRHQHLAFRSFTEAGIYADPNDGRALAETSYENCLFEDCKRGVYITNFNDYNHTFDGCEFRRCATGIACNHGNFYVRNTHFRNTEGSDIYANSEHGSSVRRCTSVGATRFIHFKNGVSPITVQDCQVSAWKSSEGAVQLRGSPAIVFDCVFSNPPDSSPPVQSNTTTQNLFISENETPENIELVGMPAGTSLHSVPQGERSRTLQSPDQSFLKESIILPDTIFDAKADFGAIGDGTADDTDALQACIDAARAHGKGAIAYLPSGVYNISQTLNITGADYTIGGSGFHTRLRWRGAAEGIMVHVHHPQKVTLEHIAIGHHDSGEMNNAIDILQTGADASHIRYDGVFVYGIYSRQPFRKGLHLDGLGPRAIVEMDSVHGNLQIKNSAQATILASISYEGSITVEGTSSERGGLLGFLSRLSTISTHGVYVRDNQSIVMSDYYVEQADAGIRLEGSPDLPPGRVTIQCPNVDIDHSKQEVTPIGDTLTIDNYHGQAFFGHNQFYGNPPDPAHPDRQIIDSRIMHSGSAALDLTLFGSVYYGARLVVQSGDGLNFQTMGNRSISSPGFGAPNIPEMVTAENLTPAFDDLRHLGIADAIINHFGLNSDTDGDKINNFEEYLAKTNPFVAEKTVRASAIRITRLSSSKLSIEWDSVPEKNYRVFASDDLSSPFIAVSERLTATDTITSYCEDHPIPKHRFYRVYLVP